MVWGWVFFYEREDHSHIHSQRYVKRTLIDYNNGFDIGIWGLEIFITHQNLENTTFTQTLTYTHDERME